MKKSLVWILALVMILAMISESWAARPARVDVENAEIYEGPGRKFKLLEKLPKGTALAISNVPSEGFFKVRTPSGIVGWISADSLQLLDPDKPEHTVMSAEPVASTAPPPAETMVQRGPSKRYLRMRAFGGLSHFNVTDVNTLFTFDGMKDGLHFGGEFAFLFQSDMAILVRVEQIRKNVVASDTQTSKTFQLDMNSTPVMLGFELDLTKEGKLTTQFAVMGGLALHTNFTSTALNLTAPNTTELEDTAFTGFAKFNAAYAVAKNWGFFAEGGYRLLKTQAVTPGRAGSGSSIFTVNGAYVPLAFDLSGLVLGGGLFLTL